MEFTPNILVICSAKCNTCNVLIRVRNGKLYILKHEVFYVMEQSVRVTKIFLFDMAHALYGYDGACKNIHGHTYKLSVTIKGTPVKNEKNSKNGMVLDFADLKALVTKLILSKFDHALVLNKNSPHKNLSKQLKQHFEKIIFFDNQPTCENLLLHFKEILLPYYIAPLKLVYLKLEETPASYAEWLESDN